MPLSQDDQKKYKALYLQTARQYVKELQDNLTVLLSGKELDDSRASLHRAAHSLVSQSAMMGYHNMSGIASVMEKIFLGIKDQQMMVSQEAVTALRDATSDMEACLEAIDQDNQEKDLSEDLQKLRSLTNIPA